MRRQADQDERAIREQDKGGAGPRLTAPVRVFRIRDGQRSEIEDAVVRERTIALVVDGQRLLRLQCLPDAVEDLALGLLVTAALLPPDAPLPPIAYRPEESEVRVEFTPAEERLRALRDNLTLGSGCGSALSSVKGFDPLDCWRRLDTSFAISADTISRAMRTFLHRSDLFVETGGVHAAAIAAGDELVAFAEDIGRHNAFDKVIGACRRQGIALLDKIALVTGRLSLELVAKAVPASLPVLVSRGAPTDAAVRLADEANLTLVGFARADRMNVYAAEWRIK